MGEKLPNMDELVEAFVSEDLDVKYYYDRRTGGVVGINEKSGEKRKGFNRRRFLPVPRLSTQENLQMMEDFIGTLENDALRNELSEVLRESPSLTRFIEILNKYPDKLERWPGFRRDQVMERLEDWLYETGIDY